MSARPEDVQGLDLDGLLQDAGAPRGAEGLQARVWEATACALRRRRLRRRVLQAAAGLALFAAGLGAGLHLGAGISPGGAEPAGEEVPDRGQRVTESPASKGPRPQDPEALVEASALAEPRRAARLLLRAGDLFLERTKDLERAAACYHLALDMLPPEERGMAEADTWLLAAMKLSQS